MRFTMFKTVKPKSFNYTPRFYDPDKEERERRKAALGLDNTLSDSEKLRARMDARWRRNKKEAVENPYRNLSLIIYVLVIGFGVYYIFFTDLIYTFLRAFGIGK